MVQCVRSNDRAVMETRHLDTNCKAHSKWIVECVDLFCHMFKFNTCSYQNPKI